MSEVCHGPRISGFFKAVKVENDGARSLSNETIDTWLLSADEIKLRDVLKRNALRSVPAAAAVASRLSDDNRVQRLHDFLCLYLRLLVSVVGYEGKELPKVLGRRGEEFDRAFREEVGAFDFRFGALDEAVSAMSDERAPEPCCRASISRLNNYFRGAANADGDLRNLATEYLHNSLNDDFNSNNPFLLKLWFQDNPHASKRAAIFFDIVAREFGTDWFQNWYAGFLAGNPLDWDAQRRVALIDDAVWEAGPEAVAAEIERIRVEMALGDITGRNRVEIANRHGIGGNNPPEGIEQEQLVHSVTLIWSAVEDLEVEVARESPGKDRVAAILEALTSGLAGVLKWCASKGDLAVDTVIKWGVPASGAAYVAKHPEKIEALIKAVERWLPFLS